LSFFRRYSNLSIISRAMALCKLGHDLFQALELGEVIFQQDR